MSQASASQGLVISIPHSIKSFTFRVASVAPQERTMAAIIASNWLIGLPALLREAEISAKASAASLSKLKTRPAKSSLKMLCVASQNPCLRAPAGIDQIP